MNVVSRNIFIELIFKRNYHRFYWKSWILVPTCEHYYIQVFNVTKEFLLYFFRILKCQKEGDLEQLFSFLISYYYDVSIQPFTTSFFIPWYKYNYFIYIYKKHTFLLK